MMESLGETCVHRRWMFRLWLDNQGQDMIEYALAVAGFALAAVAFIPNLYPAFSTQYSKVVSVLVISGSS